ncbi:sulfatase-like hydrolase/transferase [Candidatus Poribacteria bacterium]|nr:sulfatase-like hydrolase/transferase [Candidatus Poribacteria bacterium]
MPDTDKRPNILFFFTDQQRWDTCGCYGQELPITPNLDKMADDGVKFDKAFTCQPVCGPARACLQTGKYAEEIGVYTNNRLLPLDEPTVPKWLGESGYETSYIGKWHLASCGPKDGPDDFRTKPVPPERRGGYKDYWLASDVLEFTSHSYDGHMFTGDIERRDFPEGRYRADVLGDWTLEYLDTRSGGKPFFLFLSFIEPHHQNDHNRYEGPKGSKERWADYKIPGDLVGTEGDWRENFPDYLGCCNSLDSNLGRIRAKLDELGIADNTLLIFTSDHGSHFRTRNGEYKRSCHDACIHVPMVICGPGFTGGKVVDDMVSLIDLPPTIMTAGGLDKPGTMKGNPLQGLLDDTAQDWPDDVFLQISESQCGRAIRTKNWKYSVRAPHKKGSDPNSELYIEDYLYDLDADPHERNNLVADPAYRDIRLEMEERLKKCMVKAGEEIPEIRPKEICEDN